MRHGYVTAQQALDQAIDRETLKKLVQRGTLERAAFGVYRFPKYPVSRADPADGPQRSPTSSLGLTTPPLRARALIRGGTKLRPPRIGVSRPSPQCRGG